MGCWGITAFKSDEGLDAVEFIRKQLPQDGKVELGKIIEALQNGECRLAEVDNLESHSSPMALTEIMVKFLDQDTDGLDYDEEWAAKDNRFNLMTSFVASKESVGWLRDYLSDTLLYTKKYADLHAHDCGRWAGWFEKEEWIGWQEHMANLISRLDTLLAFPENQIELITLQEQKNAPLMGQ